MKKVNHSIGAIIKCSVFCSQKKQTADEKRHRLEKDYGIKMTREYDEVVDNMCNISGYYTQDYEDAVAKLMKANDTIAEKDNEIAEKDSMIAEKDNEIAELRARVQAFEN